MSHFPGFDLMRLLAAGSVLLSHSYLIAQGSEENEPLVRLLGHGNILGLYGVFTFFIISGFLLARSLSQKPSAIIYVTNRSLRILPAFFVCVLVTAWFIGPAFSSLGAWEHLANPGTWTYIGNSFNTLGDTSLPGLFAYDGSAYSTTVNGSLWSLRYEALSYLSLFMVWILLRRPWPVAVLLLTVAVATRISPPVWSALPGLAYTLPYFAGGVLMYCLHRRVGSHRRLAVICAAALIASGFLGFQSYAFALFGAYLVVCFGECVTFGSKWIARMGDCSYGLYLYGWPVQQMVMQTTGTREPLVLFAIALPLALLLGWLSCHLVEVPAMRLRKPVATRLSNMAGRIFALMRGGQPYALIAAKATFLMAGMLVLTSKRRSYDFMESMLLILGATIALSYLIGSAVAVVRRSAPVPASPDDV